MGGQMSGVGFDNGDPIWERLIGQIAWYSARSRSSQRAYKFVKVSQLVLGAAVPLLVALRTSALVAAVIATVVVVAEGLQQIFRWHETWLRYRATAEALKHEKFMFLAEAGIYAESDRRSSLARRIEFIAAGENSQWHSVNSDDHRTAAAGKHEPAAANGSPGFPLTVESVDNPPLGEFGPRVNR